MGPERRAGWSRSDVLVPAFVAAACQFDVWSPLPFVSPESHRLGLSLVFLASSLALVWRRRAPLAVLAFVYTISTLLYLTVGAPQALGTFLPQLVAVYSVGRYGDTRNLALAAPLVVLGTVIQELEDPSFTLNGPTIFYWGLLAGAWPVGHTLRQRERTVEALSQHADELQRDREAEAKAAVAAERARIARELHDVVGHGVSVIVLQVVAALGMLEKGDLAVARQRLLATERTAREALAEMRRLLGLLDEDEDASLAPQPRLSELDQLVTQTRAAGVAVELVVHGDPVDLPAGLELAVYRVAQEALTNVIKHAQPARANVRLTYAPHDVVVEIADDGQQPQSSSDGGRGIAGMRERVTLYGGELAVGPQPVGGFTVRARFPIEDA